MIPAPDTFPNGSERWTAPPLVAASVGLHAAAVLAVALVPGVGEWALGSMALNHIALGTAGLRPRSALLGPNISRLGAPARARHAVALTFDDGPDPEVTPAVLDLLDALAVRATFFCIAERAHAHPALTRTIVARGHDVQNHSLRHRHTFALLGPGALRREIGQAQAVLADITGRTPHCFRAPAGLRNPFLDPVLHRFGLTLVSWTRRGFDTRARDADRVLQRLATGLGSGDILLLHDGNAGRTRAGVPVVLQVLPALVERLRHLALRPETLVEALPPRRGARVE
ncbi:MAG: polysaccharide deacetylase family protein [Rubrivivax sp.]